MELALITIYCIHCDNPKEVEIDQIEKGQFVVCEKCGEEFNLFGIYEFLYNGVSLAKNIVDILTSAVYGTFRYVGKENDIQIIDRFRKASDFDSLLRDIVFDTVLFGNAFIEKVGENEGFLKRIVPTSIEIITSWRQRPPWRSYSEEIDKLIQRIPKKREVQRDKFFHFAEEKFSGPIGLSVLGFWFSTWYNIVFAKTSQMRGLRESGVIGASTVPHYLIFPKEKYSDDFKKRELSHFNISVRWRRKRISRVIEREVLPMVLGRPFDIKESPRFEFI